MHTCPVHKMSDLIILVYWTQVTKERQWLLGLSQLSHHLFLCLSLSSPNPSRLQQRHSLPNLWQISVKSTGIKDDVIPFLLSSLRKVKQKNQISPFSPGKVPWKGKNITLNNPTDPVIALCYHVYKTINIIVTIWHERMSERNTAPFCNCCLCSLFHIDRVLGDFFNGWVVGITAS